MKEGVLPTFHSETTLNTYLLFSSFDFFQTNEIDVVKFASLLDEAHSIIDERFFSFLRLLFFSLDSENRSTILNLLQNENTKYMIYENATFEQVKTDDIQFENWIKKKYLLTKRYLEVLPYYLFN